jgi:hypothetical protein
MKCAMPIFQEMTVSRGAFTLNVLRVKAVSRSTRQESRFMTGGSAETGATGECRREILW